MGSRTRRSIPRLAKAAGMHSPQVDEVHERQDGDEPADEEERRGRQKSGGQALARPAFKPCHGAGQPGTEREGGKGDPELRRGKRIGHWECSAYLSTSTG